MTDTFIDLDWARDFLGTSPSNSEIATNSNQNHPTRTIPAQETPTTSINIPTKASTKKAKKPWLPEFPSISAVRAMGAQIWDNGSNPGKGRAQHTLLLRVYLDQGQRFDIRKPDWHRYVQMIEPKKVIAWAEARTRAGTFDEEALAFYRHAYDEAEEWKKNDPSADWYKMGHIGSKPGAQYYRGQFVVTRCDVDGTVSLTVYLIDDGKIEIEELRRNTRSKKYNAPTHFGFFDPCGAISGDGDDDDA